MEKNTNPLKFLPAVILVLAVGISSLIFLANNVYAYDDTINYNNYSASGVYYDYVMTHAGSGVGEGIDCRVQALPPAGFVLNSKHCVADNGLNCLSDICLWKKSSTDAYDYTTTHAGSGSGENIDCRTQTTPPAGYTIKSWQCLLSSGYNCLSDICLWRKSSTSTDGYAYTTSHVGAAGAGPFVPVNCGIQANPGNGYALNSRQCVFSAPGGCSSDVCLWRSSTPTTIACTENADCGNDGFVGTRTCSEGVSNQQYVTYTCNNAGTLNASCTSTVDTITSICAKGSGDVENPPGTGSIIVNKTAIGGDEAFNFTVTGDGYAPFTITTVGGNGQDVQSNLVPGNYSATEAVPSGWLQTENTCSNIVVVDGQTTTCSVTNVIDNPNPVPTITSISPSVRTEGDPGFTMTIIGTNFIGTSVVHLGSLSLNTTYISSTELTANFAATPAVGIYFITVVNPAPGGGTSNAKIFTVNALQQGLLRLVKSAAGNDTSFDYTITGPTSLNPTLSTVNGVAIGDYGVNPGGNYSITETLPIGWDFNSVYCDKDYIPAINGATNIEILAGQTTTCTFTNTETGQPPQTGIRIIKNAIGGDTTFNFSVTGGPTQFNPISIPTNGGSGANGPTTATPGNYTITETVPSGWTFDSVMCSNNSGSTGSPALNAMTGVSVIQDQITTCTFTNTKTAVTPNTFLKINKEAAGGDDTFYYDITGPLTLDKSINTNNTNTTGSFGVLEGTYDILETLPNQWNFISAGCNNGSGPTGSVTSSGITGVVVIAGQTTTCVFGNIKDVPPAGTGIKIVKNASGGNTTFDYEVTGPSPTFNPSITTTNGTGISGPTDVFPGTTYSIQETLPNGWSFDSVFCDKNYTASGNGATNITVIEGQITTCTFNNTKSTTPDTALKIIKNALGGNGTFEFTVTGPDNLNPQVITSGGVGSTGILPVAAGSYDIAETVPSGWNFNSVMCDHSYSQSGTGANNVSVVAGQTTTCIFTDASDSYPAQTSIKIVKNAFNGDNTFNFTLSNPPDTAFPQVVTSNGVGGTGPIIVAAGDFSLIETVPSGWTYNSILCDHAYTPTANGANGIAVVATQTTTCLVTNTKDDVPPGASIKIIKNTSNGNGSFDYTVSGATPLTPNLTTTNGTGVSGPTAVTPGTYDITETLPADWTFDTVFCSNNLGPTGTAAANGMTGVVVNTDQLTTCSFSNTKNNPVPTITFIDPATRTEGDLPFTMMVHGTGFMSTIYFGSLAMPTTHISGTQLSTFFPVVPPVGTYYITVVNPGPGGGTSNAVPFTVNPANTGDVYASNLGTSGFTCPILPATSMTYFYWNYNSIGGNNQKQFQLQISENSDYSGAAVDRTFGNLSNPPGALNQQTVQIKFSSTNPAGPGSDFINFGVSYYWRVRVWETDPISGGLGTGSAWATGQQYTAPSQPGPYTSFTFNPSAPGPNTSVAFNNTSVCYDSSGPAACASYNWNFGDNSSSTQTNPSHAYSTAGNYNVNLRAYDGDGNYCEAIKSVPVFNNVSNNGLPFFREISPF